MITLAHSYLVVNQEWTSGTVSAVNLESIPISGLLNFSLDHTSIPI